MKYDLNNINDNYGEKIEKEYLNGSHASELALKYLGKEEDYCYILSILKMRGVKTRTRSEIKKISDNKNQNPNLNGKRYSVNQDFFKTWSHEMAYILGYIATDGCVSEGRVLRLGLTIKDESLLYKIKKIMEFGGPVLRRISRASGKEYESSYMNIYNREIVKDLKELGIVQNKTFILGAFDFVPKEYELDFIRGAFDGDGSVGRQGGEKCKNNYQIRVRFFSASKAFLTYIRDVLTQNGLTDVKIYQDLKRKTNFYYIIYSTNDSINFYNKIYNGASIYLDRKKEKFDELVSKRIEYENLIKNKNKLKVLTES